MAYQIKKGDKLKCLHAGGMESYLTVGEIYTATDDEQEGIFANRPFAIVIDNQGKHVACHASRFTNYKKE